MGSRSRWRITKRSHMAHFDLNAFVGHLFACRPIPNFSSFTDIFVFFVFCIPYFHFLREKWMEIGPYHFACRQSFARRVLSIFNYDSPALRTTRWITQNYSRNLRAEEWSCLRYKITDATAQMHLGYVRHEVKKYRLYLLVRQLCWEHILFLASSVCAYVHLYVCPHKISKTTDQKLM